MLSLFSFAGGLNAHQCHGGVGVVGFRVGFRLRSITLREEIPMTPTPTPTPTPNDISAETFVDAYLTFNIINARNYNIEILYSIP
jgi:hypothetical protein